MSGLDNVKKYRVIEVDTDEPVGAMEPLALFNEDGTALVSGGSGVDLSAVNQDINVLNGHVVDVAGDLVADPAGQASIRWEPATHYAVVVESTTDNGGTDFVVVRPGDLAKFAGLTANSSGGRLRLTSATGEQVLLDAVMVESASALRIQRDLVSGTSSTGLVQRASDNSYHRIVVAPDGTLSTVPVTYP